MKSKILSLFIAIICLLCCSCCTNINSDSSENDKPSKPIAEVTYQTYGSFWMRQHDYKTMPIGAFNSCPNQLSDFTYNYIAHEETFLAYQEAKVNLMMGLYEYIGSQEVANALDYCTDYGLSYLLPLRGADSFVSDTIPNSSLQRVKYHDAFGGIMQADEPGKVKFEDVKKSATILDSVMPEDVKGALWHVNLFPNYANQKQLYFRTYTSSQTVPDGGYTYQQYVDDYLSICKPQVLSYDFYPCERQEGSLKNGYFENMSIIRSAGLKANVPFWVYVQTVSYSGNTRIPNKADILWQVNTALSYGAKGIQYFTGVLPTNGDGTGEQFTGAMFDRDGNKTEVYNYVKETNEQVSVVDEVLMCCKSKGLIVSGSMPWDNYSLPIEDTLSTYEVLKSVNANHVIVGCFDYNGKPAYYVTNNSVTEGDNVTLNLNKSVSGYVVQKAQKKNVKSNSISFTMEAGEGVLFVVE